MEEFKLRNFGTFPCSLALDQSYNSTYDTVFKFCKKKKKNFNCFWYLKEERFQTLQKPKGTKYESRKSSTCHPGRVSIKYSDMLLALVEPVPSTATLLLLLLVVVVVVEDGSGVVWCETLRREGVEFESEVVCDERSMAEAASLTPVRRNLSCLRVCSLAEWIDTSHSLQRIALSCWQNVKALLSFNTIHVQQIKTYVSK